MSQTYNTYYPMVPFTFDQVRQGGSEFPETGWNSNIFIGRFVLWIDSSSVGHIYRKIAPQTITEENGETRTKNFEFIGNIGTVSGNYNVSLSWKELP